MAARREAHGFVVVDKAAGQTSARALDDFKRTFRKVGHAGTLDPFATGVLLVLLGDATRLSELAMGLPKTYRATVRFGRETDTLDPEGEVVAEADPGEPRALPLETGEIEQVPPAFSALKVKGERAYKLARKGEAPALKPRRVRIDAMRVVSEAWPEVELEIVCGAGTYVRAIARDLGRAIGLPASLAALRRTAIGPFEPDDGRIHPPHELVAAAGLPVVETDPDNALRFVTGRAIPGGPKGRYGVMADGALLGLGRSDGTRLRPDRILAAARRRIETPPS